MPEPLSTDVKTPLTADDINDLFKTDDVDDKPKDKAAKNDKEDKEEKITKPEKEDEDLDEDEIKLKDTDDEEDIEKLDLSKKDDEDDILIDAPPRMKEITAKFPKIFEEFPFLAKMMSRDKQYTELFGSFDDAKELADKAETFNGFEQQLLAGNTEEILVNVKETDPKAFNKIVDNYLQSLAKVDKEAYHHVVNGITKRLITALAQEGKDAKNDEFTSAALLINQFLFGSSNFVPHKPLVADSDKTTEQSEAEKERLAYVQERFEMARDDLQTRVDNTLKATISEYIDPKGHMSTYVKKNAVNDALKMLGSSISHDVSVRKNLDKLWRNALDSKFSKESLSRIQSFYLSAAKPRLKSVILKSRSEALKDLAPKNVSEKEEDHQETERAPRKGVVNAGRPSQQNNKAKMNKGETVADFFARD